VKADFSDEEIDKITDKLIKKTDREKRKKHLVRIAAGIAAVFVLVSGITACTINPALIDWLAKIVRMPFGSTVEHEKITYIYQGSTEDYSSIEELLKAKKLDIYYPAVLPKSEKLQYVEIIESENTEIAYFNFSSDDLHYTVQLRYMNPIWEDEVISEIESDNFHFNVYYRDECYISYAENSGNTYIIQSKSINDIILIAGGLRKD
jgi:hypothetical protein